jgi:hypothetical protein
LGCCCSAMGKISCLMASTPIQEGSAVLIEENSVGLLSLVQQMNTAAPTSLHVEKGLL